MNLLQIQLNMLENIYTDKLSDKKKIYSTNTKIALSAHLEMIYPVCQQWVGESFFKKACFDYIQKYPLSHYDLTFYGTLFSAYLKDLVENKLPKNADKNNILDCLPDLVKWEWALHFAQCGPNHINRFREPIDRAEIDFEKVEIGLPNGCSLIYSTYPIEKLWLVHESKEINHPDFDLKLNQGEYYWWIGLVDGQLLKQSISQSTFLLLNEIRHRGILAAIDRVTEITLEINVIDNLVNSLKEGRLILL